MAISQINTNSIATGAVGTTDIANGAVGSTQLASTLDLTGKTVTLPAGTGGKLLKVTQSAALDPNWTTTSTTASDITGLSLSITPTSASSQLIISLSTSAYLQQGYGALKIQLVVPSVGVINGPNPVYRMDMQSNRSQYIYSRQWFTISYFLNSWGTDARTIYFQGREGDGSGYAVGITDALNTRIYCMEIAA